MRASVAIVVLLAVSGCARPQYGWSLSPGELAYAKRYPGVQEAQAGGLSISEQDDGVVAFDFEGRRLLTLLIDESWVARVRTVQACAADGRAYHWGALQWETDKTERVEVVLRYFGDESVFLLVQGAVQPIRLGTTYRLNGESLRLEVASGDQME